MSDNSRANEGSQTDALSFGTWSAREFSYERWAILDSRGAEVAEAVHRRHAVLIAAAPELLAALKENIGVGGACEICWRKAPNCSGPVPPDCDKCARARALIRRIEQETK